MMSPQSGPVVIRPMHTVASLTRMFSLLLAGVLSVLSEVPVQAAPQETPSGLAKLPPETWQVLYVDDQRLGYSRTLHAWVEFDGGKAIRTDTELRLTLKRFGQTIRMHFSQTTHEAPDGRLLAFQSTLQNPPAGSVRTTGIVRTDHADLTTDLGGQLQSSQIRWAPDVIGPARQDQLLAKLKPGQSIEYTAYVAELNQIVKATAVAGKSIETELYQGKTSPLLRVELRQPNLPTTTAYVDANGQVQKTESDFVGSTLVAYTVSREVALQSIAGAELDIATQTLVHCKPIVKPHQTRRAAYRLTIEGQDAAKLIPTGVGQAVQAVNRETVDVTVTAVRPGTPDQSDAIGPEFVKSSQYLQIGDPAVVAHTRKAIGDVVDPWTKAVRMEKYVHGALQNKNFSTAMASAAEVAKKLEGDCTEHAVLLAAMLRAEKIPSRVVVGLVYADGLKAFGGHMWTEAGIDGRWIPLDATLGQGGIGAAHIRLIDTSLNDDALTPVAAFLPLMNLLGRTQLTVVSVEGPADQ